MFRFRLVIDPKNFEKLDDITARLSDFTAPFVNIISEWARDNVRRKFAASQGAELSGLDQPPARWTPVTPAYYRQKHGPIVRGNRTLYPDWLMVRTGRLKEYLGERGGFAEFVDNHRAVFGTPMDTEAAAAASGNKDRRPTIFLDRTDRNMVRRELQRYLNFGENYRQLMKQFAGRRYALKKMAAELDMQFGATI